MRRIFILVVLSIGLMSCGRSKVYGFTFDGGFEVDAGLDAGVLQVCIPGELIPARSIPSVVLLVDKSASMNFDLSGVTTSVASKRRWNILQSSLSESLLNFDSELSLGLALFPFTATCGGGVGLAVNPALGQGENILAQLKRTTPRGGTPTFDALVGIENELNRDERFKSKTLILVTDGIPNCNAQLPLNTCECTNVTCTRSDQCSDIERTVNKIELLNTSKEVTTYVVGIGTTKEAPNLNRMAQAGGAARTNSTNKFFAGNSNDELTSAFSDIALRLRGCHFSANTALTEGDIAELTVQGTKVEFGMNGWVWTNQSRGDFVLQGVWCEKAINGEQVLMRLNCRNP